MMNYFSLFELNNKKKKKKKSINEMHAIKICIIYFEVKFLTSHATVIFSPSLHSWLRQSTNSIDGQRVERSTYAWIIINFSTYLFFFGLMLNSKHHQKKKEKEKGLVVSFVIYLSRGIHSSPFIYLISLSHSHHMVAVERKS